MVKEDSKRTIKQIAGNECTGNSKRVFKIIVVGDSNVGKTCLTYRFCEGKFLQKSEATIGVDFRERTVDVNGEEIKLQLWDTAGQERFRKSMVQHYYRNVHAVVIVYDVTKVASFQSLPQWIEECNRNNLTSDIPRILVGNKCDGAALQVVNTHSAQQFADMHHMPLFETSALDESQCDHVEAIFMTLAHKLKNRRPMMSPSTSNTIVINGLHRAEVISVERESRTDMAEPCWC